MLPPLKYLDPPKKHTCNALVDQFAVRVCQFKVRIQDNTKVGRVTKCELEDWRQRREIATRVPRIKTSLASQTHFHKKGRVRWAGHGFTVCAAVHQTFPFLLKGVWFARQQTTCIPCLICECMCLTILDSIVTVVYMLLEFYFILFFYIFCVRVDDQHCSAKLIVVSL